MQTNRLTVATAGPRGADLKVTLHIGLDGRGITGIEWMAAELAVLGKKPPLIDENLRMSWLIPPGQTPYAEQMAIGRVRVRVFFASPPTATTTIEFPN
jgi:hypothetical protein